MVVIVTGMEKTVYDKRSFRNLPREECLVGTLLGLECFGLIHLHHTDPSDPDSRLVPVCAHHHPKIHALLRTIAEPSQPEWRTCNHIHRTREGREACERRLNRAA